MGSKKFLKSLFEAHQVDLNDVQHGAGESFICPICLEAFSQQDIFTERLSDGHVWPAYLREKSHSQTATMQRVLLCKSCNSKAGSLGDKQMQVLEQVKDGEETGQYFGERKVEILTGIPERPIKIHGQIVLPTPDNKLNVRIQFPVDKKTGKWQRNDPKEQARFEQLRGDSNKFSLVLHPYHELRPALAQAGWVTSAYLLAFYTFGYRYIFHPQLDPIRQYILESSTKEAKKKGIELPKMDTLSVQICSTHYHDDPVIGLILPLDGKSLIHLQVDFLNYHIKLPIHVNSPLLGAVISERLPTDFDPNDTREDAFLYSPVQCTKATPHDCLWDYVLGKSIPPVEQMDSDA